MNLIFYDTFIVYSSTFKQHFMFLSLFIWLTSSNVTFVIFQNNVQSDGVGGFILRPMVFKFGTIIILIMTQMFIKKIPELFHLAAIDG